MTHPTIEFTGHTVLQPVVEMQLTELQPVIETAAAEITPLMEFLGGATGPGLPPGTTVKKVGSYLEWTIGGNTYHFRLLAGPAPV